MIIKGLYKKSIQITFNSLTEKKSKEKREKEKQASRQYDKQPAGGPEFTCSPNK